MKNSIFFCFLILIFSELDIFHQDPSKVMTDTLLVVGGSPDAVGATMLFVRRCQQSWTGAGEGARSSP